MSKNNYFQKNYGGLASDPENNNKGTWGQPLNIESSNNWHLMQSSSSCPLCWLACCSNNYLFKGWCNGWTDGWRDGWRIGRIQGSFIFHPDVLYNILVWAPCIMHSCVIYPVELPHSPGPSHFSIRIFTSLTAPRRSFPFSTPVFYPVRSQGKLLSSCPLTTAHPESGEGTFFLYFKCCCGSCCCK
jgi:hypothetical protein